MTNCGSTAHRDSARRLGQGDQACRIDAELELTQLHPQARACRIDYGREKARNAREANAEVSRHNASTISGWNFEASSDGRAASAFRTIGYRVKSAAVIAARGTSAMHPCSSSFVFGAPTKANDPREYRHDKPQRYIERFH